MADVTLDLGYGRKIVSQSFAGPATYTTGGFIRRMSGVNKILDIIKISNDVGMKVEPADCTINNNAITIVVRCYEYTYAGACGPAVELTNLSAALAAATFDVTVLGT